jgi:hypothetical protein
MRKKVSARLKSSEKHSSLVLANDVLRSSNDLVNATEPQADTLNRSTAFVVSGTNRQPSRQTLLEHEVINIRNTLAASNQDGYTLAQLVDQVFI